jgi:hypothetical protein
MNFKKDLKEALVIEEQVAQQIIENKNYTRVHHDTYNKGYDLHFTRPNQDDLFIEVKHDKMTQLTGNIAIEVSSRGELSGLSTTTSQFWVIVVNNVMWIIPVEKLRYLVKHESRKTFGGDIVNGKPTSEIYLICYERFKDIAKKIN